MDQFQVNAEEQDLWHSKKLLRQGSYFSIRANINKACEKTSAALQYQKLQKRLHYFPQSPCSMVSPTCRDFLHYHVRQPVRFCHTTYVIYAGVAPREV